MKNSSNSKLKIGIIGGGWVATTRHIPSFLSDKRTQITTFFDRDINKAALAAKKYDIPLYFDQLDAFLKEPLDAVSICTPPFTHAEIIRAALVAGKHVLVEKPMTMTSSEGKELEQLASKKGLLVCPTHNFLYSRSMQKAQGMLRSGKAGEICWAMGMQISSWRRRLPTWSNELPGGLFFDEAPHLLYLMGHFLGNLQVENAWRYSDGKGLLKDMERVETRLRGEYGHGYLTSWFGAPYSEWLFTLFCSKAVLVLDLFRDVLICMPSERSHGPLDVINSSLRGMLQHFSGSSISGLRYLRGRLLYGHDVLIRRFIDAVTDNTEPPVTAQDGWQVIELIENILEQSGTAD